MTKQTYCRICEAHCGLIVDLNDDQTVSKIRPDKDHTISQGFVCAKGLKFGTIADHPQRLQYPQVRDGDGNLRQISWDAVMHKTGEQLRDLITKYGRDAVAIYLGTPMIRNGLGTLTLLQWVRSLGTRNYYSAASQDNANKFASQQLIHNSPWLMPIVDIEHTDLAILIGTNPLVSQGTFVHMPQGTKAYDALLKRGGNIVVIDPRESESAKRWGGHIAIRPNTDIFLLLALLHQLRDLYQSDMASGLDRLLELASHYSSSVASELTGIAESQIRQLATQIRQTEKTTFMLSVGVNQGSFGTLCFIVVQAIAYLTGNFDTKGGLLFNRWAHLLELIVGVDQKPSRMGNYMGYVGGLPCGILADEILTEGKGQIKALIVVSGNPLTSVADENRLREAFQSLDLLVSIDIFENQTAQLADVILPASTWLERFDIAAWDTMYETANTLQTTSRVRDLPAETRTERQILSELSWRSGTPIFKMAFLARIWAEWDWDNILPRLLKLIQWLFRKRDGIPWLMPKAGLYQGKRRAKLRFWDEAMLGDEPDRLAQFTQKLKEESSPNKLILIGRRRRLAQNSWIHNASRQEKAKEHQAWLSHEDMTKFNLSDADCIQLRNETGSIEI
ncbi:MAG: molybdopterin-dependent oxidoreductase [Chloroflexota bacterium]